MISPADVEISEAEFRQIALQIFDADDETLERLYPMVCDLREMAAAISTIVMENKALSETATGE